MNEMIFERMFDTKLRSGLISSDTPVNISIIKLSIGSLFWYVIAVVITNRNYGRLIRPLWIGLELSDVWILWETLWWIDVVDYIKSARRDSGPSLCLFQTRRFVIWIPFCRLPTAEKCLQSQSALSLASVVSIRTPWSRTRLAHLSRFLDHFE